MNTLFKIFSSFSITYKNCVSASAQTNLKSILYHIAFISILFSAIILHIKTARIVFFSKISLFFIGRTHHTSQNVLKYNLQAIAITANPFQKQHIILCTFSNIPSTIIYTTLQLMHCAINNQYNHFAGSAIHHQHIIIPLCRMCGYFPNRTVT